MNDKIIYYLAIDIGASSGRHVLVWKNGKTLYNEEVYRFNNGITEIGGELCWDLNSLFNEIKNGMKRCAEIGKPPSFLGIDMWGVDFVLLDKDGSVIGNTVSYRDNRTADIINDLENIISEEELYNRTGIKKLSYNTIYQLFSVYRKKPEYIKRTESLLLLPSYLSFLLTGIKYNEYTEAGTTCLMNIKACDWDYDLIDKLGFDKKIFIEIKSAGTIIGNLKNKIADEIGFNATLIMPAAHDTASAVLAAPDDESIFISSGTWSLIGVVLDKPVITREGMDAGFSNEGAYGGKIKFLKNIMGLWMLQSVKKEWEQNGENYDFEALSREAELYKDFPSKLNVNDNRFLAPKSMISEIKDYCRASNQPIPQKVGEICSVIYQSLTEEYKKAVAELEKITGKNYPVINIIGGGCKDRYLCRLTAEKTGKKITAGPAEATALGNALAQMLATGEVKNIKEIKKLINN